MLYAKVIQYLKFPSLMLLLGLSDKVFQLLLEWHTLANILTKLIIEFGAFVVMEKLHKDQFGRLLLLLVFMN